MAARVEATLGLEGFVHEQAVVVRTVDVHVRRLREKLPALEDALVTVKQFGYKLLEEPPTEEQR